VSLKKYKSQGKAVEVTGNNKAKNSEDFVWISSKNSAADLVRTHAIQRRSESATQIFTLSLSQTVCTLGLSQTVFYTCIESDCSLAKSVKD